MTRPTILIVGGYGAFGSRLAERLAREPDLHLIIAGRDASRAAVAATALGGTARATITSAAFDAAHPDLALLAQLAPAVIINASGPFQDQDYALAKAAIAIRAHYIDLADARKFVVGISALDAEARAADVLVVSGASTVPAISAAVIDHYAARFQPLHTIDIGITPGNSFDPGLATTQSILRGLGETIQVHQGGQPGFVHGWEYVRRQAIPGLGRRWLANCDVPDLELFPKRYKDAQSVTFGAGVEVGLFHHALVLLAGLKRIGLIKRPERFAPALLAMKRRLSFLGTDRGGMAITMQGPDAAGQIKTIDWFLVAGSGQGPYIPTVAATLLARRLARGEMAARGAMPCIGLITLDAVLAEVTDLDISAREATTPLYRRVLGKRFAALPPVVRALHDVETTSVWSGRADVERGSSVIAKLLATLFSLPPDGRDQPLRVSFTQQDISEIWTRVFGVKTFRSVQSEGAGELVERVGPVRFTFALETSDAAMHLRLRRLHVFGLPIPRLFHPRVETREWQDGARYRFDVASHLPGVGLLVHYTGWLEPDAAATTAAAAKRVRRDAVLPDRAH
jgi:saccharopine dehydrogenase-like NADP-dependent oxidoreductase